MIIQRTTLKYHDNLKYKYNTFTPKSIKFQNILVSATSPSLTQSTQYICIDEKPPIHNGAILASGFPGDGAAYICGSFGFGCGELG